MFGIVTMQEHALMNILEERMDVHYDEWHLRDKHLNGQMALNGWMDGWME